MKISIYFAYLCLIVSLIGIFNTLFIKKEYNYSEQLINFFNQINKPHNWHSKEININDINFHVVYFNKNNIITSKDFDYSFLIRDKEQKEIYDFEKISDAFISISSEKYFDKFKLILSDKQLNEKQIKNLFKTKITINYSKEDYYTHRQLGKQLIGSKKYKIKCQKIDIDGYKIKICEKKHFIKLKNYNLSKKIFNNSSYFYFRINNKDFKFSDEEF